ncbi:MAG: hypothetical protein RL385_3998 [Pseudomonadota bacterium]|jgi:hypothetical protein
MLRKIPLVFALLVTTLVAVTAMRSGHFVIARSGHIAAPPAVVYGAIEDFRRWPTWSPWEGVDPGMKRTYSGPERGIGAKYAWAGTDKVGEGAMTIVEAEAPEHVGIELVFIKPWAATNRTDFTIRADGAGSQVTWAMRGEHDFVGKLFALVLDMERMVGPDFERGLAQLSKALSEKPAAEGP